MRKVSVFSKGVLGVVVTASISLSAGTAAHAADLITVPVVTSPSIGSLAVFIAGKEGLDVANGIKFTENLFTTGPTIQAALVSGTVKFTAADTNNWIPWSAATGPYTVIRQLSNAPFLTSFFAKDFWQKKQVVKQILQLLWPR